MLADNSSHSMNTEGTEYDVIEIRGIDVYYTYIQNFNAYDFVWSEQGYMLSLTCTEGIDFNEAVKIIENIAEK